MRCAAVLVVVAALAAFASAAPLKMHVSGQRFADEDNRERFFHGMNVVNKVSALMLVLNVPYVPVIDHFDVNFSFSQEDVDVLTGFGLNVIRLSIMMDGAMPAQGAFNETYLSLMQTLIEIAASRDMYVMIETHQDCFSASLCGEGFPTWLAQIAVDPMTPALPLPLAEPYAIDPVTHMPSAADCAKLDWSDYQFTAAQADAYQKLYTVGTPANQGFSDHWRRIVQRFKNNTNVIGYELINEPFAGNIYKNPELMIPSVADRVNLQPFYDNLSNVIREQDPNAIIWFESVTWDDFVPMGFEHPPGGFQYSNQSVISLHYYFGPNVSPMNQFAARYSDAERYGTSLALTEFLIDPSDTPSALEHMSKTMDAADKYQMSWFGWDYKVFEDTTYGPSIWWPTNGTYNWPVVETVARTYPQAVAGKTFHYSYDVATRIFILEYYVNAACKLPTDIFLAEDVHYQNGYTVSVNPSNVVTQSSIKNHVYLTPTSSASNGKFVTVVIGPTK
ncbi:endoglycoceramidase [Capsaspora owczarzaki ATCC 30864]|uniref:Endoglycoceramidase n=1 Tax=Capsaspora owczarzaki (strain ATCC 30864) TaxID=595528 RepID=A0A0D2WQU2_CAPO3|nr:endoglycoceramidase [Capsaspora owczarzaki ATCC 30864]KJE93438.1 endoglycoceramidase [Capsaspora owczarzaki ATCC 30864]|eukprot:XP_004348056.2 endoglycoceramidase [Capsaspora owczarzaki ATCC 30864]